MSAAEINFYNFYSLENLECFLFIFFYFTFADMLRDGTLPEGRTDGIVFAHPFRIAVADNVVDTSRGRGRTGLRK